MYKIIKNAAQCRLCGDVIESKTVHDYVACKCGAIFVDGGKQYLRRGFVYSQEDFIDMSEIKEE